MKKQLNTDAITNELEGSVFFPSRTKKPSPHEPVERKERDTTDDTAIPRYHETIHDTLIPSNHDTTIPTTEEGHLETIRRTVKKIGKESATHRCTIEEKDASDDIVYLFKKQHIFTSDNEIRRIGTNYIIADYHKNGENSILAKVLKRLNS